MSTPTTDAGQVSIHCPLCEVVMTAEYLHHLHPLADDIRRGWLPAARASGETGLKTLDMALRELLTMGLDHDDFVLVHRDDWARARAALKEK